MFESLGQG
uniref:Uncharacterized protein n=1 Tax=Rhizophora mucronata TaxID=61149 RepID=A0A2P2QKN5_RHIMU